MRETRRKLLSAEPHGNSLHICRSSSFGRLVNDCCAIMEELCVLSDLSVGVVVKMYEVGGAVVAWPLVLHRL